MTSFSAAALKPAGYLTENELAALVGVPQPTLARWRVAGLLESLRVGRFVFLKPIDKVGVIAIRNECQRRQREQGRANAIYLSESLKIRSAMSAREECRPQGALDMKQCAQSVGVSRFIIESAVHRGELPSTKTGRWIWVSETDLAVWVSGRDLSAERSQKESATRSTTQRYRNQAIYFAPPKTPRISPKASSIAPSDSRSGEDAVASYDASVAEGKADPRFAGALGFNLIRKEDRYQVLPVGTPLPDGWRYHQRHHKNGYGQWQVRTMHSVTGEVHL